MKTLTRERKTSRKRDGRINVALAYAALESHPHFRGRARNFELSCDGNVLVVRGAVPSYYLKQVLQTALKDVEGLRRIDNQVSVRSVETGR